MDNYCVGAFDCNVAADSAHGNSKNILTAVSKIKEKYPDLQVRVCGWNVRWNSLSRWEQEHFLRTALAQEGR